MENEKIINLFIIDDNILYATALKQFLQTNLENFKYYVSVQIFNTSESCMEILAKNNTVKPDIIILDYFLNSRCSDAMNGLSSLFQFKISNPDVEVIFLSMQSKIEVAVETLRTGAFDYIVKDDASFPNVLNSVQDCLHEMKRTGKIYPDYKTKSASL